MPARRPSAREDALVAWFRQLFAARTPARDVQDALPSYRVSWTEIRAAMARHGYDGGAVDLRAEWARIHHRHRLGPWCGAALRAAGEAWEWRRGEFRACTPGPAAGAGGEGP